MHEKEKDYKGRKENSPPPPLSSPVFTKRRISNWKYSKDLHGSEFSLLAAILGEKNKLDGWKMEEREREAVIATHNEFHLCAGRTARPSIHPSVAEGRRSSNEEQT